VFQYDSEFNALLSRDLVWFEDHAADELSARVLGGVQRTSFTRRANSNLPVLLAGIGAILLTTSTVAVCQGYGERES